MSKILEAKVDLLKVMLALSGFRLAFQLDDRELLIFSIFSGCC